VGNQPGLRRRPLRVIFTAVDDQGSGAGIVRVVGTWSIVAGLLTGVVAAKAQHMGYLFVAGLLVLIGVALRIEAAMRDVDANRRRPSPPGVDHYR